MVRTDFVGRKKKTKDLDFADCFYGNYYKICWAIDGGSENRLGKDELAAHKNVRTKLASLSSLSCRIM